MKVRVLDAAIEEAVAAIEHYAGIRSELGDRFEIEFEEALVAVATSPEIAPIIARGVRRRSLASFPYGIVYACVGEIVVVGAVMHLSRRPGYWKSRFKP